MFDGPFRHSLTVAFIWSALFPLLHLIDGHRPLFDEMNAGEIVGVVVGIMMGWRCAYRHLGLSVNGY
jgi:hypothetical protein